MDKQSAGDYILQFIPTGSKHAVSRDYLSIISGLEDRDVRRAIETARKKFPIINLSNGKGYYLPDMSDPEDVTALKRYKRQEENRLDSINQNVKAIRRFLGNYGF